MDFSRETVENALRKLSGTPEEANAANNVIMRWRDSPTGVKAAVDIITESQEEIVIFMAACGAAEDITHKWMTYHAEIREIIRMKLCERVQSFVGSDYVRQKIIDVLIAIAMKDWPDEWPDCLDTFIGWSRTSPEACIVCFRVMGTLIDTVRESSVITAATRKRLWGLIADKSGEMLDSVAFVWSTFDMNVVKTGVCRLLESLCLVAAREAVVRPYLIEKLVTAFAVDPETSECAVRAMSNLLVKREDCDLFMQSMADNVIRVLALVVKGMVPRHFVLFLIQFLTKYGVMAESIVYDEDVIDEELHNCLEIIYRAILRNTPEECCYEFWTFWKYVLGRYTRASKSRNVFQALQPCVHFFRELLPKIRKGLYNALPSATENGKLVSLDCQDAWILLSSADKDGMKEFISSKMATPDVSTCFAVGIVTSCLTASEEKAFMTAALPVLFACNQQTQSVEFGMALLYALSRSVRYLGRVNDIMAVFSECLISFVESDDYDVQCAAVNAIFYISGRSTPSLWRPDAPFVPIILTRFDGWVERMSPKNASRIIRAVASMASQCNNPMKDELFKRSANALQFLLSPGERVYDGLRVVHALARMEFNGGDGMMLHILSFLCEMLKGVAGTQDERLIHAVVEAVTVMICRFEFERVREPIEVITAVLLRLEGLRELALLTFNQLRRSFSAMDTFYARIYQAHIARAPPSDNEALCFIQFFRQFDKKAETLEEMWTCALNFLNDGRITVAKEASKLLRSLLLWHQANARVGDLVSGKGSQVLTALWTPLTDRLHRPIIKSLSKALCSFYSVVSTAGYSGDVLDGEAKNILARLEPATRDTPLVVHFLTALRGTYSNTDQFVAAVYEFLCAIECASISDCTLFKQEIQLDDMEALLAGMGGDASTIRAEAREMDDLANELRNI